MVQPRARLSIVIDLIFLAAIVAPSFAAEPIVILQTRQDIAALPATIWRGYEMWRTDVARRADGTIVPVDMLTPRMQKDEKGNVVPYGMWGNLAKGGADVCTARVIEGAPFPADGWQAVDFDDHQWSRVRDVHRPTYRAIALSCLRGKFSVVDPAQVVQLNLILNFRGGAAVYMNGTEIKRVALPDGRLGPDTLADEYPTSAYIGSDGRLLSQIENSYKVLTYVPVSRATTSETEAVKHNANTAFNVFANETDLAHYKSRLRTMAVAIPPTLLRKGTNVLAIEIHRAPADPVMFTAAWPKPKDLGAAANYQWYFNLAWNRCAIDDLTLTVEAPKGVVAENLAPPKGMRVWNHPVDEPLDPSWYGDPNESVAPIHLCALRNGVASGQIIVSSTEPIRALKASISQLAGPKGQSIAGDEISIGYARTMEKSQWNLFGGFDRLDIAPPDEIKSMWWSTKDVNVAIQPVWVTVKVGPDHLPGQYVGKLTLTAKDQPDVIVPVVMDVVGNWILPEPSEFKTYVGLVESPETLASYYKVPMWSDPHWKLLDRMFGLMADFGTREIYIPITGHTLTDNTESMVRWIKQADGKYTYDYSLAERYLDLATKHLKQLRAVCFIVLNCSSTEQRVTRYYTEFDPATGKTTQMEAPAWGTPEAKVFWKPVIEGLITMLDQRGLADAAMLGIPIDYIDSQTLFKGEHDLQAIFPKMKWLFRDHSSPETYSKEMPIGHYTCMQGNDLFIDWDPDPARITDYTGKDKTYPVWYVNKVGPRPDYGWKTRPYGDVIVPSFSRDKTTSEFNQTAPLSRYLIAAEGAALTRMQWRDTATFNGLGSFGADFWRGWRWSDYGSMGVLIQWFFAPGIDGPVPTVRSRMLQQSLQDQEARIFIENAVMDPVLKSRLSPALIKKINDLCDRRTHMFVYLSSYYKSAMRDRIGYVGADTDSSPRGLPEGWDDLQKTMYDLTGEVADALAAK